VILSIHDKVGTPVAALDLGVLLAATAIIDALCRRRLLGRHSFAVREAWPEATRPTWTILVGSAA